MPVGQLITKKCFIDKSGFHNLCHGNISKRIILMNFFRIPNWLFLHWNIHTIRIVDCCDSCRWAYMWGDINGKQFYFGWWAWGFGTWILGWLSLQVGLALLYVEVAVLQMRLALFHVEVALFQIWMVMSFVMSINLVVVVIMEVKCHWPTSNYMVTNWIQGSSLFPLKLKHPLKKSHHNYRLFFLIFWKVNMIIFNFQRFTIPKKYKI
jgi:hypothetical protein